jgi:hypothetical protein
MGHRPVDVRSSRPQEGGRYDAGSLFEMIMNCRSPAHITHLSDFLEIFSADQLRRVRQISRVHEVQRIDLEGILERS